MDNAPRSFARLLIISLIALLAVPVAAQDLPTDDLLLRLQSDALDAAELPSALHALDTDLDRPTPYTAAAIHPHNGRWSVMISQGTLDEGAAPSRFLSDETAEFFFYDRVLNKQERDALRNYMAANYKEAEGADSDGLNQGIHVQGSWSVEVRDPDGTLAERREFENSLVAGSGDKILADLIAGNTAAGNMEVTINGPSEDPICRRTDGTGINCYIVETGASATEPYEFATLTKSVPTSGDNENALVLSGSATVETDEDGSVVVGVTTHQYNCAASTAPGDCGADPPREFLTSNPLQSTGDIPVQDGQQVNVEVVISFN